MMNHYFMSSNLARNIKSTIRKILLEKVKWTLDVNGVIDKWHEKRHALLMKAASTFFDDKSKALLPETIRTWGDPTFQLINIVFQIISCNNGAKWICLHNKFNISCKDNNIHGKLLLKMIISEYSKS